MQKRELIALLMESPFYFEMPVQERLEILKYNERKLMARKSPSAAQDCQESAQSPCRVKPR